MDSYKTSGSSPSKNRIEYPDKDHVLLSVETIRLYATQGKSPYVGIPVVTDGSRSPLYSPVRYYEQQLNRQGTSKPITTMRTKLSP